MRPIALWNRSQTQSRELAVFGMACPHCEDTVATVLSDLEGVTSVDVSLAERRARVDAEPSVSVDDLIDAVRAVGYEARPGSGT